LQFYDILIPIGLLALISQFTTASTVSPDIFKLINHSCANKRKHDLEFLKTAHQLQPERMLKLKPWKIGQYVVYAVNDQIKKNIPRFYKITIKGKESFKEKTYFWLEHALYDNYSQKAIITLSFLCPEPSEANLINDPAGFFLKGTYPEKAEALEIKLENGPIHKIAKNAIKKTISSLGFHTFQKIPLNQETNTQHKNLHIFAKKEQWTIGEKSINGYHLLFKSSPPAKNYMFNAWHSKEIPVLGLFKLDLYRPNTNQDYNTYPEQITLIEYGEMEN